MKTGHSQPSPVADRGAHAPRVSRSGGAGFQPDSSGGILAARPPGGRATRERSEHGAGMPRELAGRDACPTLAGRPNRNRVCPQRAARPCGCPGGAVRTPRPTSPRLRLPRPARHERGEGWGEGSFSPAPVPPGEMSTSSPQPSPPFRTEERETVGRVCPQRAAAPWGRPGGAVGTPRPTFSEGAPPPEPLPAGRGRNISRAGCKGSRWQCPDAPLGSPCPTGAGRGEKEQPRLATWIRAGHPAFVIFIPQQTLRNTLTVDRTRQTTGQP